MLQRDEGLEYLLAEIEAGKLHLRRAGHLKWAELQQHDHPLLGRRLICGLGSGFYATRRLKVSAEIAKDGEQLEWELRRGLTEDYDHYHRSLFDLAGTSGNELLVFTTKRRAAERLGQRLAGNGLTLDQMVFEPEALFRACRLLAGEGRTLVLLVEAGQAQLMLLVQRKLVTFHTLSLRRNEANALLTLVEDIGTVLLATPYGRTVDRSLQLILAGDPKASGLADAFARALPYDIELVDFLPRHFDVHCSAALEKQFARWFLPFSLAHLYHEHCLCASSPVNDAASR